jgi:hypothetical protein
MEPQYGAVHSHNGVKKTRSDKSGSSAGLIDTSMPYVEMCLLFIQKNLIAPDFRPDTLQQRYVSTKYKTRKSVYHGRLLPARGA